MRKQRRKILTPKKSAPAEPSETDEEKPNYLGQLVSRLKPAVISAVKYVVNGRDVDWMNDAEIFETILQLAVETNVRNTCAHILEELPDVKAKVESGEVSIVQACYNLGTGQVQELEVVDYSPAGKK